MKLSARFALFIPCHLVDAEFIVKSFASQVNIALQQLACAEGMPALPCHLDDLAGPIKPGTPVNFTGVLDFEFNIGVGESLQRITYLSTKKGTFAVAA